MKLVGLQNIRYEISRLNDVPHILFIGARGTGKSTLAKYIAESKRRNLLVTIGNTLTKQDILNILINIKRNDIWLIDEIHRLSPQVEEILYSPMESFKLAVRTERGTFQEYKVPKFSLIGTTTKPSCVSAPLVSRFQIIFQIPHYSLRELAKIIRLHYPVFSIKSAVNIAHNVVTPREAINLSRRIMSLRQSNDINSEVESILRMIGYQFGLSKLERFYIKVVYNLGTASLQSLSNALQIDKSEVLYIEDKLIRKGLVNITSRGRSLTFSGMILVKKIKQPN